MTLVTHARDENQDVARNSFSRIGPRKGISCYISIYMGEYKAAYEAGDENFEQYDDLTAWEFAEQGKVYWEKQLQRGKVEHHVS